jgi:hypothetical protein
MTSITRNLTGSQQSPDDIDAGARTASGAALDSITILKSITGLASKRIVAVPGGSVTIENFNAGAFFRIFEARVSSITELSAMLKVVEAQRDCFVIRGAPRNNLDLEPPQRRRKINFQTPLNGRRWVLIDFDKIPLPARMSLHEDIGAVCEHLIKLLPAEFHNASYHWQLSSSAGITDTSVVSLHLWFWLDRPIPDAPIKAWSKWWNEVAGAKIVDPALFNDVQAHYTAAPTFVGMDEPFSVRSGLTRKAVDEVALKLPRAAKAQVSHAARADVPPFEPSGGFEAILAQIGDHPDGAGFHLPIIRAAASYVATNGREGTDVEQLYGVIRAHVLAADRSKHDDAHAEQMASEQHIVRAIEQALDKYAQPGKPRRKSRNIPGLPPHFTCKPVAAAEASALLRAAIGRFFGAPR